MQFALRKLPSCASPPPYLGRITSCQAPLRIDTAAADLNAEGATSRDWRHTLLQALNFLCARVCEWIFYRSALDPARRRGFTDRQSSKLSDSSGGDSTLLCVCGCGAVIQIFILSPSSVASGQSVSLTFGRRWKCAKSHTFALKSLPKKGLTGRCQSELQTILPVFLCANIFFFHTCWNVLLVYFKINLPFYTLIFFHGCFFCTVLRLLRI